MNENKTKQPVLDTLVQSRELQMLKSMVPYFSGPQQRMVSLVIKLVELQKTMQLFNQKPELQAAELRICENESPNERTCHMLNAMKEYCTPQEQENIDVLISFFDMYASYETMFSDGNSLNQQYSDS